MSAYLRFWKHVSNEDTLNENDLFVFDSPSLWRDFRVSAPSFHIVIRCGEKSEINVDTAAGEIKVNKVRRTPNDDQTLVPNVWGAAKGGKHQFADQLFDYHKNGFLPVPKNPQQGFQGQPKDRLMTILDCYQFIL